MAAQAAAEMSERTVHVVEVTEMQAGLAILVGADVDRPAIENAEQMRALLGGVRTGSVARAARSDPEGRFIEGDAVGYVANDLVAWGEPAATLGAVVEALSGDAELISIFSAADAPLDGEQIEELVGETVELEMHAGGQPSRWWLLSAE
jgi:dihydroxyacetone kinase-like predicted kinase